MTTTHPAPRIPWNLGRIIGPKPPFKPKHIWAIRTRLQHHGQVRDLAMFNVAIDSKLRGCNSAGCVWPTSTRATACDYAALWVSKRPAGQFLSS